MNAELGVVGQYASVASVGDGNEVPVDLGALFEDAEVDLCAERVWDSQVELDWLEVITKCAGELIVVGLTVLVLLIFLGVNFVRGF